MIEAIKKYLENREHLLKQVKALPFPSVDLLESIFTKWNKANGEDKKMSKAKRLEFEEKKK
jgi:hypothetical protein